MAVPIQAVESRQNGMVTPFLPDTDHHILDRETELNQNQRLLRCSRSTFDSDRSYRHLVGTWVVGCLFTEPSPIHKSKWLRAVTISFFNLRNAVATKLPLAYEATILGDRWTATAKIHKDFLPAGPHRWNATAIHGDKENRTYLSWVPLPGTEPDFHQPDATRPLKFEV